MPLWTPADLTSGTAIWLDADDASTITEVSGAVSQWSDKSGNARHAVQGSATLRPIASATIGGKTALQFDGTNDQLVIAAGAWHSGNWTSFIVIDPQSPAGAEWVVSQDDAGANRIAVYGYVTDVNAGMASSNTDNTQFYSVQTAGVTAPLIVGGVASNTTATAYASGVPDDAPTAITGTVRGGTINTVISAIPGSSTTLPVSGSIAEIVLLDYAASDTDRQLVEGYLAHKWGITLDAAHPYYAAEPRTGSDVRGELSSPIGAVASTVTVANPYQIRTSLSTPLGAAEATVTVPVGLQGQFTTPLGALEATLTAPSALARCALSSPLGAVSSVTLNDFSAVVTDPTARYVMRITGDPVVEIPISSWQATVQGDRQSFLQAVVPAASDYADILSARQGTAEMVIYRQTTIAGLSVESEMARASLDTIQIDQGPTRYTATLRGYTAAFSGPVSGSTVTLTGLRSVSQTVGGAIRVRADIDWNLRPGQTATDGGLSFTVGYINYFVPSTGDSYMDAGSRG